MFVIVPLNVVGPVNVSRIPTRSPIVDVPRWTVRIASDEMTGGTAVLATLLLAGNAPLAGIPGIPVASIGHRTMSPLTESEPLTPTIRPSPEIDGGAPVLAVLLPSGQRTLVTVLGAPAAVIERTTRSPIVPEPCTA